MTYKEYMSSCSDCERAATLVSVFSGFTDAIMNKELDAVSTHCLFGSFLEWFDTEISEKAVSEIKRSAIIHSLLDASAE